MFGVAFAANKCSNDALFVISFRNGWLIKLFQNKWASFLVSSNVEADNKVNIWIETLNENEEVEKNKRVRDVISYGWMSIIKQKNAFLQSIPTA